MIWNLLKNSAKSFGDYIAVICGQTGITYRELYENVGKTAGELKANGVGRWHNTAVIMNNSVEFIEAFFAINMCEAAIIPVYMNTGRSKLINIINFYDIRYIVTAKRHEEMFDEPMQRECIGLKGIFYIGQHGGVLFKPNAAGRNENSVCRNADDPALVLFSSGTTNIPKGIMLSNSNITSNVEAISHYLALNPSDRVLLVKNMNHASSITGEMLVSIRNGCRLIITPNIPAPSLMLDLIQKERITVLFAVPTILSTILNFRYFDRYDSSSVRIINFYGANMGYAKMLELSEKFPGAELIYSYGLTEASPRVTYILKKDWMLRKNSSGLPVKDVEVFIIDGEIAVKGPNVMMGYYRNPELTEKALDNGVLHTGDLGWMDGDGYLYVTGRKDNLIIQSGRNVYPEEIESVLSGYDGIREVLVRGEEDELLGARITAYVVPEEGCRLDIRDILGFCGRNLEDYKIPKELFFVGQLQKTAGGKIIRRQQINVKG